MSARAASWLVALAAASVAAAGEHPERQAAADGCIHGTVTTYAGRQHTGLIRWGGQETFWDDIFHSMKEELSYASYAEPEQPAESKDERWWEILGRKLAGAVEPDRFQRVFAARFGDIASIDVVGSGRAVVEMRSGTIYRVRGYSNDVGAAIEVREPDGSRVSIDWGRLDRVDFSPAPAGTMLDDRRLFGTVETDGERLSGFIQWDEDECLAGDRLDGDAEGGRISIPFAAIVSIEPQSSAKASVVLDDGRAMVLRGTNDVNSENRGVFVEDSRFGRVRIPWPSLRRVELSAAGGTGRSLAELEPAAELRGTVTTGDGSTVAGRLHFDLDESETWELLDGSRQRLEYMIPFARIRSLHRTESGATAVLVDGLELALDGGDVGDRNAGVVVELDDGGERFVRWRDVARIDFTGAASP